jgi:hypothetical protein
MAAKPGNPADRIVRTRLRETVSFPDLTERRALRLAAATHYTARSHFAPWHRILGTPDFAGLSGIFTPLVYAEIETADTACEPGAVLRVRGESYLARTLESDGSIRHLVREGRHTVCDERGALVARTRLVNVFTRYDPDPARRRVTELPPALGLGPAPSRVTEVPGIDALVPRGRAPEFVESATHVWHYGQTDPNRHVNGMAYLREMEAYAADVLHARGQDLTRVYSASARIVFRKPSFRGDGYRRVAWFRGEAPLVLSGAFVAADHAGPARPVVAVELAFLRHENASETPRLATDRR